MGKVFRVMMITSEWPNPCAPHLASFVVRQVDALLKAGIEVDVFHFRGAKNPINYFRAWVSLRKKLSKEHYDLIHAQWGQSALLAWPKKHPLVVTFRGSDVEAHVDFRGKYLWQGRLLNFLSRLVATRADEAIVVSARLTQRLPDRDYHIIPSGLDLNTFVQLNKNKAREALGISLNAKVVMFGGDPRRPEKRYSLAEIAIELLSQQMPDIQFIVPSNVPHPQMPVYLNAADVLLLTSLYEGSPNVIKEALACNLPLVSTNVGDVRERIRNIEGCEVCIDDRPETIAAALSRVLSRGQRIDGRHAVLDLDEKLLTQKVIQVYYRAIQRRR